ncbi:2-dehydropantoate 2-reductase [Salinibacillus xinjiangensis]|uniref:2-dehydropantoate 2-reductase n=1 Tax=Salinibacillus xinjiangensis TaxID=1229268 RepID=UPI001890C09E|nr:2-dehydropantoate 2-reductase [Salinibacillus xinjiangensis]
MNIGIIGAGSTGLLLAASLAKSNHKITMYVRRKTQQRKLQHNGVHLRPNGMTSKVDSQMHNELGLQDLYIICVKQPVLQKNVEGWINQIPRDKPILFLQNGMSHVDVIADFEQPIFVGVLDHGAKRVDDYTVEHTGIGEIRVGIIRKDDEALAKRVVLQLHEERFPIIFEENTLHIMKRKLIVNAVINPLTAMFNVRNGRILENAHLKALAKQLCYEACLALDMDFETHWIYVKQVAKKTESNSSSMREDVKQNQQTEVEAITGYLLQLTDQELPYNSFIYHGVQSLSIESWNQSD